MLNKDAELLIVAHQRAADLTPVFYTGTAQFTLRVGEVADAHWVALDIALLCGLTDAQHDLPPPSLRLQGRVALLCCIVWRCSYYKS